MGRGPYEGVSEGVSRVWTLTRRSSSETLSHVQGSRVGAGRAHSGAARASQAPGIPQHSSQTPSCPSSRTHSAGSGRLVYPFLSFTRYWRRVHQDTHSPVLMWLVSQFMGETVSRGWRGRKLVACTGGC